MGKFFKFALISIFALLVSVSAFALDSNYKNNLLNLDFSQAQDESINISLFFEKPYSTAIKANFKGENQYNILLPETYHSITSAHFTQAPNVKSVEVKLIPSFDNNENSGYTKITITTTKPSIFNAKAYLSTTAETADAKLAKLLDETTPAQKTAAKTEPAKTTPAKTSTVTKQQPTAKTLTTKAKTIISQPKTIPTKTKKPTRRQANPKIATRNVTRAKSNTKQRVATKPQTAQKPIVQKPTASKALPQKTIVQKPIAQKTIPQKPVVQNNEQPKEIQAVSTKPIAQVETQTTKTPVLFNGTIAKLTAIIALPLILLIWLLKLFNKNDRRNISPYNDITEYTEEKREMSQEDTNNNYSSIEVEGTIDGSLSWQEKYRLLKESEEIAAQKVQDTKQSEISDELDNIYNTQNSSDWSAPDKTDEDITNKFDYELSQNIEETNNNYKTENDTESLNIEDIEEIEEIEIFNETTKNKTNFDTLLQDNESQEYTAESLRSPLEGFNYDYQISRDDYNITKTLMDELEEQELAQENDEFEIVQEESTAEITFEDPQEDLSELFDEIAQAQANQTPAQSEDETQEEIQENIQEEVQEKIEEEEEEEEKPEILIEENQEKQIMSQNAATNPISNEPTLITQVQISKSKGFYLIKYDTETALVGYIKDQIFVLNTFEGLEQTFVQTRLNEKKQGKEIYIVRSNNYKSLVEVSKDEMKTVIEL